ncbi:histidine phosphatase family protein [Nocardioides sambongensis]|uniref:histidine phosphatase family protein n=1 Tax=Nocardioides sambongensis TaxID=2589074 RepID=UPI00112A3D34|nr:histidine phosphatase family protein [Nocardioides sambongensis]
MTRRIVLLRHGQTAWNAERRIQGQLDSELDATGLLQAKTVAPVVAAMEPTLLVSSDLKRARATAEAVAEATGLSASYDVRVREFHLGDRQGLTHDEYAALAPAEFARFRAGEWRGIPGAESPEEVASRYRAALVDVADALGEHGTAVVVSHGAAIKIGTAVRLGWPLSATADLKGLGNCGRVVLEEADGRWRLAGYDLPF